MRASKAFGVAWAPPAWLMVTLLVLIGSSCKSGPGGAGAAGTGGGAGAQVGIGTGASPGSDGNTGGGGPGNTAGAGAATGGANNATGGVGNGSGGVGNSATGGAGNGAGGAGGRSGGAGGIGSTGGAGAGSVIAAGVRWFGRVDTADPAGPRFGWSGTGFVARFTGTSLAVRLSNAGAFVFKTVVDGIPQAAFTVATGQGTYNLGTGLPSGMHTIALYRQTEGVYGDSQLLGLTVGGGTLVDPPPAPGRLIEVVGASVSCGYGNLGVAPCTFSFATESHWDTYESVAARALGAELSVVAISGRGVYRNFDGTTDGTMPRLYNQILAGAATPTWDFRTTPQAVIINLGKNDLTLGDPGAAFVDAYVAFTRTLRTRYPDALIVCTTGPNLGATAHAQQLGHVNAAITARRAQGENNIELLDWTEETPAETGCDVHPTAAKHSLMGAELAALLRARLGW